MAERYNLTKGCLLTIMRGGNYTDPVVQVLGCKKINPGNSDKVRHRVILSDGVHSISYAMMTTDANDASAVEAREMFSVIKLNKYITTTLNNTDKGDQRVLLILEFQVIAPGAEVGEKLGSTTTLTEAEIKSHGPLSSSSVSTNKPPASNGLNNSNSVGDSNFANQIIHPIDSLTPYQNRWVIKARVTAKSQIRSWSNSKGEGTLFNFTLVDESGEIRVAAFRDAVDKFYDYIQVDKVYYISRCQLKPANKQYSTVKNDYEMTLNVDSVVQECQDSDDASIPQVKYDFVPIDKIAEAAPNTMLDVIGVIKSVGELQSFQSRVSGRELKKKEVMLVDQSQSAITLTLWGEEAETFEASGNPVIAIKGARVGEFGGGKNLSTVSGSSLKMNPEISESYRLRAWYDQQGSSLDVNNISAKSGSANFSSPWMSFAEVREQNLGSSEKGHYFQVMGTILLIRSENAMYKACPTPECNKKIIDLENGMYRCEKCNREFPNFKYRLLANMNVGDFSGNQWMSMFNSEVEKILGMTAQEVGEELEQNPEAMTAIASKAHFKQYIFKCRTKMETFNDEKRLKTVCVRVDPINFEEYNTHLSNEIEKMIS